MPRRHQYFPASGLVRLLFVGLLLAAWTGCAWTARGDAAKKDSQVSLAPLLRLSNPAAMTLTYNNACGDPVTLSLGEPLAVALKQRLGQVFQRIVVDPAVASDGAMDVALNLKQIELTIPPHVAKVYPVTVRIGLEAAYATEDGSTLWTKKVKSSETGAVEVQESSCDVIGLDAVVKSAANIVAQGLAMHASESSKIRDYAEAMQRTRPSRAQAVAASSPVQMPADIAPQAPPAPVSAAPQPSGASQGLTFRAILRDENRDHILQPDESLTIELEVKNDGPAEARGVEVVVGGTGALTAQLPPTIVIGDVQPGEIKREVLTKPVIGVQEPLRGELLFGLRAASPMAQVPPVKKFTILVKPGAADGSQTVADVDQLPKGTAAIKQPKAVVVAIGVGRYRDPLVPAVKFAARDAEIMGASLQSLAGLPADRVRVLTDGHGLKQDFAETFEEWLPKRVDANTVVYVYVAGRALVDGATGAVSLVPYDGTTASMSRVYSLRRLQESLARLPIQRAILMFDVSLEHMAGADPAIGAAPTWETGATGANATMMWMIGNNGLQEAQAFEAGRHGLFTYQLLRGLQGPADLDRDGIVAAGELCAFARGEVARMTSEQIGSSQQPVCLPAPGQGALVRIHPLAKGNNPKPMAPGKKEAAGPGEVSAASPAGVGPGQ
ncbi:MAG: hypothetical protein IT389_02200 [Nitrospira sp.]|nr:hypothetical protein [Nitrospira sp.]